MNNLPIKATKVFYKNRDSTAQIVINRGGSRSSKCLAKGTEVVMFDGYLKKIEDVKIGDKVMGIDSSPRTVTELHQGIGNLYLISQNKGIDYVVEEDHLLALKERYGKNSKKTRYLNISIRDYLQKSNKFFRRSFGYKNQQPIEFLEKYIPKIEPYLLGLWIADGRKDRFCFSVNYKDVEIADSIYTLASEKYRISIGNVQNQCRDLLLVGDGCKNYYVEVLKELGIHNNKHIPLSLRQMSVKNRLEFLAGYIDGDGYLLKGNTVCYSVCSSNFMIIEGIKFIGHSLGFSVQYKLRERFDKRTQKNYKSHELIIGGDIERIPVRLSRKKIEGKSRKHDWNISSLKVTLHGIGEYYGFSLDGDGLFLLKDFTVVHNSFSISQLLFLERFFTQKNKKFLVLRKTLPSLRLSVYQDFKNFVNTYNLEGIIEENKQFLDYYYKPNNNYLHFGSLDDAEKIKSSQWSYIWMNEATDFDEDDFLQLLLRLSEPTIEGQRNQLFMCFNPIDEFHWIKTKVLDKREIYDLEEIHSTYKDNPFLSEDYKKLVESYLHIDFNKYKVYALGEWGKLENLIYTNWDTTTEYVNNGEIIYGLDFGFTNPSALLKLVINDKDIFEEEIIYQTGLTNSQLIEKCNELGVSKIFPIYADNAEPDRIQEFREAGYNVIECVKDVLNSIDFVKRFKIHCYKPSINLVKEKMGYSRRKDKNGRLYEEPAPNIADHLMACESYAIFTHLRHRYNKINLRFI